MQGLTLPSSSRRRKPLPKADSQTIDTFVGELFEKNRGVEGQGYPQSAWWTGGAREKQLPPEGDWRIWLILAGRGFGKTRSIVEWGAEQARLYPGSRGALVGATASDVRDVLVTGESGFLAKGQDGFMPIFNPSKSLLTWPNGSIALLFSADEPLRLRGKQHHWAVCDELAQWRYPDSWDQLLLGLRLGLDPRVAIATTPRPTPLVKRLLSDTTCITVRGTTYENRDNLAPAFMSAIINRYEGTTLGRQELNAEILDDMPGALWKRPQIEADRVSNLPELVRIVVAVDPAVTANEDSDETGIVVAGIDNAGHGYVIDDKSLSASPEGWARQAIAAFHTHQADRVIVETNNGGDMLEFTLRTIDNRLPITQIRASRGKQTRAEPIAALYEQSKIHHVGLFGALEDQMCSWVPGVGESPDRVDALVWALTELMLGDSGDMTIGKAPDALAEFFGGVGS